MEPNSGNSSNGDQGHGGAAIGALVGLALFVIIFSVSDLEMGLGGAAFHPIHLAFAAAVILLCAFLFRQRRRSGPPNVRSSEFPAKPRAGSPLLALAAAAFVGGPLLTFVAGLLCVTVFDVHPMDRGSVVASLTTVGFFVGVVLAVVLAVAGSLK
jgi:hypothetical protein